MTDAGKALTTLLMLGMMVDETRVAHTCQNCRFRIEHDGLGRCARCGKYSTLDGSCPYCEVRIDD